MATHSNTRAGCSNTPSRVFSFDVSVGKLRGMVLVGKGGRDGGEGTMETERWQGRLETGEWVEACRVWEMWGEGVGELVEADPWRTDRSVCLDRARRHAGTCIFTLNMLISRGIQEGKRLASTHSLGHAKQPLGKKRPPKEQRQKNWNIWLRPRPHHCVFV